MTIVVTRKKRLGFMLVEAILGMVLILILLQPLMQLVIQLNRFVLNTIDQTLESQERAALQATLQYECLLSRTVISTGAQLFLENFSGESIEYGVLGGRFFRRKQGSNRQYLTKRVVVREVSFHEPYPGALEIHLEQETGEEPILWELVFPNQRHAAP